MAVKNQQALKFLKNPKQEIDNNINMNAKLNEINKSISNLASKLYSNGLISHQTKKNIIENSKYEA